MKRVHNEIPNSARTMAADMGEISSEIYWQEDEWKRNQVDRFWTEPRVRNSRRVDM